MSNKLLENYYLSLKQKYNAVCLSIDETITKDDTKSFDGRVIEKIAMLLKRRIPIIFITGRGEKRVKCSKTRNYRGIKRII